MVPDSEQTWKDEEPPNMTGHLTVQRSHLGGVVGESRQIVTDNRAWLAGHIHGLVMDPAVICIELEWRERQW
jgi:hypothetical protein